MTLLHTTDLHFNKKWFEWISTQQSNYDVFCITGDFLDDSKDEILSEQITWVSNWMKNFKKPLFVCSGNHDIEEFDNEDWLNKISTVYADNSIKIINGIKFGCIPFIAPEFYEFDECDIILYHLSPSKLKTSIHKDTLKDWGDSELKRLVNNGLISPKYILCGHLHQPQSTSDILKNTIIYNPGIDESKDVPLYIEITI